MRAADEPEIRKLLLAGDQSRIAAAFGKNAFGVLLQILDEETIAGREQEAKLVCEVLCLIGGRDTGLERLDLLAASCSPTTRDLIQDLILFLMDFSPSETRASPPSLASNRPVVGRGRVQGVVSRFALEERAKAAAEETRAQAEESRIRMERCLQEQQRVQEREQERERLTESLQIVRYFDEPDRFMRIARQLLSISGNRALPSIVLPALIYAYLRCSRADTAELRAMIATFGRNDALNEAFRGITMRHLLPRERKLLDTVSINLDPRALRELVRFGPGDTGIATELIKRLIDPQLGGSFAAGIVLRFTVDIREALQELMEPSLVPAIILLVGNPAFPFPRGSRNDLIRLISGIESSAAAEEFLLLLLDKETNLTAARELARFGHPGSVPCLLRIVREDASKYSVSEAGAALIQVLGAAPEKVHDDDLDALVCLERQRTFHVMHDDGDHISYEDEVVDFGQTIELAEAERKRRRKQLR